MHDNLLAIQVIAGTGGGLYVKSHVAAGIIKDRMQHTERIGVCAKYHQFNQISLIGSYQGLMNGSRYR